MPIFIGQTIKSAETSFVVPVRIHFSPTRCVFTIHFNADFFFFHPGGLAIPEARFPLFGDEMRTEKPEARAAGYDRRGRLTIQSDYTDMHLGFLF